MSASSDQRKSPSPVLWSRFRLTLQRNLRRRHLGDVPFGLVLVALFAAAAASVLYAGRDTTFFYDEWDFILGSRSGGLDVLLRPHNGHLSVVPILVYRLLFALVGLRDYTPYRVVLLGLHLACALLFFFLARRSVSRIPALLLTGVILFLGSGWQDVLWPFQIAWLISLGAGLLTLIALDRSDRVGNFAAMGTLVTAVASSGVGLPFLAAAGVRLIAAPGWLRKVWIIAVPGLLYGLWYAQFGVPQAKLSNAVTISAYVYWSAAGAIGGITGVGTAAGAIIMVAAVGVLLISLYRRSISPQMAAFITLPLSFWTLTAITRANFGDADATRYIYPGALFCLLIGTEVAAKVPFHWPLLLLAAVATVSAVTLNLVALNASGDQLRRTSTTVRAELGAVELAHAAVSEDMRPDLILMPQVTAGQYLQAVSALGSPADRPSEILRSAESTRVSADQVLQVAYRLELKGVSDGFGPGPIVSVDGTTTGAAKTDESCLLLLASPSGVSVTAPPGGLTLRSDNNSPIHVQLRRFADTFSMRAIPVNGSGPQYVLRLHPDDVALPWHVNIIGGGPIHACGLAA